MPGWFGALLCPHPNGQFLILGGVTALARLVWVLCRKSKGQKETQTTFASIKISLLDTLEMEDDFFYL